MSGEKDRRHDNKGFCVNSDGTQTGNCVPAATDRQKPDIYHVSNGQSGLSAGESKKNFWGNNNNAETKSSNYSPTLFHDRYVTRTNQPGVYLVSNHTAAESAKGKPNNSHSHHYTNDYKSGFGHGGGSRR